MEIFPPYLPPCSTCQKPTWVFTPLSVVLNKSCGSLSFSFSPHSLSSCTTRYHPQGRPGLFSSVTPAPDPFPQGWDYGVWSLAGGAKTQYQGEEGGKPEWVAGCVCARTI